MRFERIGNCNFSKNFGVLITVLMVHSDTERINIVCYRRIQEIDTAQADRTTEKAYSIRYK